MLTGIRESDAIKVLARQSKRAESPFLCPLCRGELILRKGSIKVHHFAHKPPVICSLAAGETEQHHLAKLGMYDALLADALASEVELEKDLGGSIADVYARIAGIRVAIEIQRSSLSVNDIVARTRNYHRLGIAVLWIGLPTPSLATKQYSPRAWEKWCHAAYYGRVYYWEHGQTLQAVHFDSYNIHVPVSTWFQDGSEQSAGGYDRVSKRWRTPNSGSMVLIARSFQTAARPAWSGGTVSVPGCTLYVDRQRNWWR